MTAEDFEMVCVQIITNSGSAKSSYIEAIQKAKEGAADEAQRLMEEGDQFYLEAHEAHASLLTQEASGEKVAFSLILVHAEDQMASTEMAKVLAREFIELYHKQS
ncbi:MAG: PTS lactose/cellobiose transporter subunit IIA [Eubacterium sp.]|nr:PTS lactose/cellobiose transporter subunit IIA [Eubacterium sp.]